MKNTLQFAVLGDSHYVRRASHDLGFSQDKFGDLHDLQRYVRIDRDVMPQIIAEIASQQADFVVHTGDMVQGNCDDAEAAVLEMTTPIERFSSTGIPFFYAIGNHDKHPHKEPVEEVVYAANSKAAGRKIDKGYYAFIKANSLFIVLDYTTFQAEGEQAAFLEQQLETSAEYDHVFIFAHPPLIPIARPFFSKGEFADAVLRLLEKYDVDAYFCGHTHNQIASIHKVGEKWLPQLKSSPIGDPAQTPIPIQAVRRLLPDPNKFELCWGYLEDTAPGWWMVTINGAHVSVDWHVLGKGAVGQIGWRKGEKPQVLRKPDLPDAVSERLPERAAIKSVRLRAAGMQCREENAYKVYINDTFAGDLPRLEAFSCRKYLELDAKLWALLKEHNTLRVTTSNEAMCIGGFVLEVETSEGWVRSSVSPYYKNADRWDAWDAVNMHAIAPGETIQSELVFGEMMI